MLQSNSDSRAIEPAESAASGKAPAVDRDRRHLFDDVLLGIGILPITLNDRLDDDLKWRVINTLLDARKQGRERELLESAQREAEALPDWTCARCGEANPGTFEMCWNCFEPQPGESPHLTAESEAVLEVESRMTLGLERTAQPDSNDQPQDSASANQQPV